MNKKEIQKEIDNSVRIFKETLEKTYLKDNREFYGIGQHSFIGFLSGKINVQRKNNGNLRVSGEISKDAFNEKCIGLPNKFDDWYIYPLVITLFNKNVGVKEEKEI